MAILKLTSSGGGVQSIDTPSTSSNFTSTLPGTTGTLLNSASSLAAANLTGTVVDARISALTASKLTGALPAISGANLTGIVSGGLTLLDTINAASGTTITSSTLNLSTYKILIMDYYSVSPAANATYLQFTPNGGSATYYHDTGTAATQGVYALMNHNLASGTFSGGWKATGAVGGSTRTGEGAAISVGLNTGLSTSTTSISWSWANSVAFDGGTIRIYGIK